MSDKVRIECGTGAVEVRRSGIRGHVVLVVDAPGGGVSLRADEAGLVLAAIVELLAQGGENAMPGIVSAKGREPVGEDPQRLPGEPSMVYRGRLMYWHLDESDVPYTSLDSATRDRWTMLASGMERLMEKAPRIDEHDPMKPWASLDEGMARRAADLGNGSERP